MDVKDWTNGQLQITLDVDTEVSRSTGISEALSAISSKCDNLPFRVLAVVNMVGAKQGLTLQVYG